MITQEKILNLLRIALGWIFLWAFLDKLFGLGYSTPSNASWLNGVSPTTRFLKFGVDGPFANAFQALAGIPIVDWLYMGGLFAVGVSLILGITTRLAAIGGSILLLLILSASSLPPEHNPLIDEHIIYIFGLILLSVSPASGQWLGIGRAWKSLRIVQKYPILG